MTDRVYQKYQKRSVNRDFQIVNDRNEAGMTYKQIAKKHNLSSVRVRQICHQYEFEQRRVDAVPDNILEANIQDVLLSVRVRNVMVNNVNGWNTKVKDVVGTPSRIMLRWSNFGRSSLNEWNLFCKENGLEFSR